MTLDIFVEKNNVAAGGSATETLSIPAGEEWELLSFGGGSSSGQCEVQIRYSEDGGSTWVNPFTETDTRLRVIHLANGIPASVPIPEALTLEGGDGHVLQFVFKNYGLAAAEIAGWVNGRRNATA